MTPKKLPTTTGAEPLSKSSTQPHEAINVVNIASNLERSIQRAAERQEDMGDDHYALEDESFFELSR